MKFMNEYELEESYERFRTSGDRPRRQALALVLIRLAEWTDSHSDGWAYWPKPARAAAKVMDLLDWRTQLEDCTEAEAVAALKPVKAFLTRQGVKLEELDLPDGYRWATADETEQINAARYSGRWLPVNRTFDSSGKLYLQDEADLVVRT